MEVAIVLERLNAICRTVFNNQQIKVDMNTNANDIKEWDSITNLFLIDSIEKEFDMKFTLDEIFGARNIGDLSRIISEKTK